MKANVILLVEDNPDDVELMQLSLKQNNVPNPVVVAHDGAEALEYLFATGGYAGRSDHYDPCLVLLDLKLPKVSGMEVLQVMRGDLRTRRIPVVVLTTSCEHRDIVNAYNMGCNSYIRKPVDFHKFDEVLRQLITYWLTLNTSPPA